MTCLCRVRLPLVFFSTIEIYVLDSIVKRFVSRRKIPEFIERHYYGRIKRFYCVLKAQVTSELLFQSHFQFCSMTGSTLVFYVLKMKSEFYAIMNSGLASPTIKSMYSHIKNYNWILVWKLSSFPFFLFSSGVSTKWRLLYQVFQRPGSF